MNEIETSNASRDALAALGLTVEEVQEVDGTLRQQKFGTDRRVCLCGHGAPKHTEAAGRSMCKPSRYACPCKNLRPVLEAEDVRPFLCRTVGGGAMHALVRGISSLAVRGKNSHWIIELKCDRCQGTDEVVVPVPVTEHGKATTYATGYDALLCQTCREEV